MVEIIKFSKGKISAKGKLTREESRRLFDFCKTFDIGSTGIPASDYLFDVRSGVIHWLDKETKNICSSIYYDLIKGSLKIELGDVDWTHDLAFDKWNQVISLALKKPS